MGLQLITAPATQPVTLEQAKAHLRIELDDTSQDAEIERLISAATAYVQKITSRAMVTQAWRLFLDAFPVGAIVLPMPPLQSVESIKYTDVEGADQTLPAADYVVNPFGLIGKVTLAAGKSWPATIGQAMAVRVEFTAGYSATPDDIVSALLLLIGHLDQSREAVVVGVTPATLPLGFDALLSPYCVPGVP